MSCCCCFSGHKNDHELPPILDVEKVLKDHVWDIARKGFWQRKCLRRKDYIINVPMNFLHFETISKPEYKDRLSLPGAQSKDSSNNDIDSHHSKGGVEIATDFVNDTDKEQLYTFRLEKTRKASLRICVQRGFSVGGNMNITLGLPKVSSAKLETDIRFNISKTGEETVEETIVLETKSDIKVKESSKCVAKVHLAETHVSYDFSVWNRMSMPTGRVPVSVVRKSDKKEVYVSSLHNLKPIFEKFAGAKGDEEQTVRINTIDSSSKTVQYVVEYKIQGIIDGVRLSDQMIKLESSDIPQNGPV